MNISIATSGKTILIVHTAFLVLKGMANPCNPFLTPVGFSGTVRNLAYSESHPHAEGETQTINVSRLLYQCMIQTILQHQGPACKLLNQKAEFANP